MPTIEYCENSNTKICQVVCYSKHTKWNHSTACQFNYVHSHPCAKLKIVWCQLWGLERKW